MAKKKTELEKKIEQATKDSKETTSKPKTSTIKGTDNFKKAIMNNLREEAKKDRLLFERIKNNPKKNIDDCITFIYNHVKKSGCFGYEDEEIYQLARHYYDEDDIEVGTPITQGEVIVNRTIQLTPKEIEEAKEKAIREIIAEEKKRLKKQDDKPSTTTNKKEENLGEQASLF